MSRASGIVPTVFGIVVAAVYLVRAAYGVPASVAYHRARTASGPGFEARARSLYERGAVGFNRYDALWFAGEAGLGEWDALPTEDRLGAKGAEVVSRSSRSYFRAASLSPATAWPWTGLADLYGRLEAEARSRRVVDLAALGGSPWALVGREGRIAVGLVRKAIEWEPFVASHRDELVLLYLDLKLASAAEDAMRETARVQPVHGLHEHIPWNEISESMVEAFVAGSLEALGNAPMARLERHLLSLGQLEFRLGRLEEAEAHLERALGEPADSVAHAEHSFHLGLVRMARKDFRRAESAFDGAAAEPVFRTAVALERGKIAEAEGRTRDALDHCRAALRLEPTSVHIAIECGRLARKDGDWKAAEEVLRWAIVVAPRDIRPRMELFYTTLDSGGPRDADLVLREARRVLGDIPEIHSLENDLARAYAAGR